MEVEEYNNNLKLRKELRDKLFELRLSYELNKKDLEKQKEILKEIDKLKKRYARTSLLIAEYELDNNIEKESRRMR